MGWKYLKTYLPMRGDSSYTRDTFGGKNHASVQDGTDGFIAPNCTGVSRAGWIQNGCDDSTLYSGNAGYYYAYKDGFERGQEPKLGAIICWRKGDTTTGHIEFVYGVHTTDDGNIDKIATLYSGYKNDHLCRAYERAYPFNYGEYNLEGFIYPPEKHTLFDLFVSLFNAIKYLFDKIFGLDSHKKECEN